jgi:hypothetical protein
VIVVFSLPLGNFCDRLYSEHDSFIHSHHPAECCVLCAVQKGIMNAMHYVTTYSISVEYVWKFPYLSFTTKETYGGKNYVLTNSDEQMNGLPH